MSYALTDAGEDDMRAEVNELARINEELDQLASEAKKCATIAPFLKRALDLAWFLSEEVLRDPDVAKSSCEHLEVDKSCLACRYFASVRSSTQNIRRYL